VAGFDLTHVLSASFIAESPFGKGKRFSSNNAVVDYVVGNWGLNGIYNLYFGPTLYRICSRRWSQHSSKQPIVECHKPAVWTGIGDPQEQEQDRILLLGYLPQGFGRFMAFHDGLF